MTTTTMIRVEGLTKSYGNVKAVDGISFSVEEGEVFGLLGHNGAGKSTTIRMLTGRTRPSGGVARVAGCDPVSEREKLKPRVNLVFEDQNLYERLSGRDNLRFFADLYGAPRERGDELLETVGLPREAAKRKVKTYSTGMKQRLLVARALVNAPRVLFLDEPTRGLDPTSARELRGLIKDLSEDGVTVLLTTHYMEEADELCDRVAFLSEGRIAALDTPRELKLGRGGQRTATVVLEDRKEEVVALDGPEDARKLENWMSRGQIAAIHSNEGTLEDVFVEVAGRSL
jgi:ABC-2 type transport system ATP-binding protein